MSINGTIQDDQANLPTNGDDQVQPYIDIWLKNTIESARRAFKVKISKTPGNRINKKASKLMDMKARLSKKIMRSKYPIAIEKDRKKLKQVEIDLKISLQKMMKNKEEKILPSIKKDPALFYSYARSFSSAKTDIGPFHDKDDNLINDHKGMADILSKQYSDMFSTPSSELSRGDIYNFFNPTTTPSHLHGGVGSTSNHQQPANCCSEGYSPGCLPLPSHTPSSSTTPTLEDVEITFDKVKEALSKLSSKAAPLPD